MPTFTIATSQRTILACAPDDQPEVLRERIKAVLRPLPLDIQTRIESELRQVTGLTLFADDVAAFRAGALDLWEARPGVLAGLTDAEGRPAKVAARMGGRKRGRWL